jgi:hypothetical protein
MKCERRYSFAVGSLLISGFPSPDQIRGGNKRPATSAPGESGSERSDSEDEAEDIKAMEFERVDESQDVETSKDGAFINDEDAGEDKENEVIAQGKIRAARGSSSTRMSLCFWLGASSRECRV